MRKTILLDSTSAPVSMPLWYRTYTLPAMRLGIKVVFVDQLAIGSPYPQLDASIRRS